MRTPNSQNHSYVHYSLSKFTGEWFTHHSIRINIFTPITRIVVITLKSVFDSALRTVCRCAKARKLARPAVRSLGLQGSLAGWVGCLQGRPGRFWECTPHGPAKPLLAACTQDVAKCTILFEIITFKIRKPLNHVTVIAKNLENFRGELFPVTALC